MSGSDVYVGGEFTRAGGVPANYVARWDGSNWHALGSGVEGEAYPCVYAIAVSGMDVYVGGCFSQAGGGTAKLIARWDGSSWHPLGVGIAGILGVVNDITISGSDVFAGGHFTEAGGSSARRIARWDGTSWHTLGNGLNECVYTIVVRGSDVYVGGSFTEAGVSPANRIARWNPNTGTEPPSEEIPISLDASLHASPNPTSTGTELSFQSSGLSPLKLEVFDTAGRLVSAENLGTLPAGSQTHYWAGFDGNGHFLAQGVYFLRLSSSELEASTRVVLLR